MAQDNLKLDLKDRKILYELDLDARQSCSSIGKKVGLSTEVVNYRIKKLEEANIITHYTPIVNLSKLNTFQFKICLTLQHITSDKLHMLIDNLKKNNSVKWLVSCKGNWDLIISFETDSIKGIDRLKNEVMSSFKKYISQKAISILVEGMAYNREYLIDKKSPRDTERVIMAQDKEIELSALDMKILKQLSENARKPIVEIATKLNTSARVINYHIQQMIKNKILVGSRIAINYEKLGIQFYKTLIYLDNPKEERIKELIGYFKNHKNIIHNGRFLANWDLEPEFEVYSEKEFDDILEDIKNKFQDIIKKIDIITISKEHKFVYF